MKRLVVVLVLLMSAPAMASIQDLDGNWWVTQNESWKIGFVAGFIGGMYETERVLESEGISEEDRERFYFPYKVGTYEVGLDMFYADREKLDFPLILAIYYVNAELQAK